MDDIMREMGEDGPTLFQAKRYAEAAEAFRRDLSGELSAGQEADTRRRLADTLASLGQAEDAAAERELAANIAEGSAGDPMALMTRGDLLKRDHRHDEACACYEQALRLLTPAWSLPPLFSRPAWPEPDRAYLMAKLALAHYEASRPAKTVIWAGASLANHPNRTIRLIMQRICGVGYSDLGDLERAEFHYSQALTLAEEEGTPPEIAQSLTTLATIQRKRGAFAPAIAMARRATETFAHPGRGGQLLEAECLRDMGRFDEARAVVAAMRAGPRHDRPDVEQRSQVICALTLAWIEAIADRPDAALIALREAWAGLGVARDVSPLPPSPAEGEDKLVLYSDAAAVRVYAQLGRAEDARRMQENVESRLPRFEEDRAGLLAVYSELAPAAFALGEFARCQDWWRKYLDCRPDVVGLTKAHCGLGEAALSLGETEAARAEYEQAASSGINSLYARRAQARLDALGERPA